MTLFTSSISVFGFFFCFWGGGCILWGDIILFFGPALDEIMIDRWVNGSLM
jgi:hypothetical protein